MAVMKWKVLDAVIAIALGFVLMFPLGMLFDVMDWALFHSWGLVHGSFILAWPLLAVLSYGLIRLLRRVIAV